MKNRIAHILKIYFVLIFATGILTYSCSSNNNNNNNYKYTYREQDPRKFKIFRIDARKDDDVIYVKLLKELDIDTNMYAYTITVNIKATDTKFQYIIIYDYSVTRFFPWLKLSEEVRNGLVHWYGTNKTDLENNFVIDEINVDSVKKHIDEQSK